MFKKGLTLNHTEDIKPVHMEVNYRGQLHFFLELVENIVKKKEKILVTIIFSYSHHVFKSILFDVVKSKDCVYLSHSSDLMRRENSHKKQIGSVKRSGRGTPLTRPGPTKRSNGDQKCININLISEDDEC